MQQPAQLAGPHEGAPASAGGVAQTPAWQVVPAAQALPQAPQLAPLFIRLGQLMPH
jgi:hypothetical protein